MQNLYFAAKIQQEYADIIRKNALKLGVPEENIMFSQQACNVLYLGVYIKFNDIDTYFENSAGTLHGKPVKITGKCNLYGVLDFNVLTSGQDMGDMIKIVRTSPMLADIQPMLAPIKSAAGPVDFWRTERDGRNPQARAGYPVAPRPIKSLLFLPAVMDVQEYKAA